VNSLLSRLPPAHSQLGHAILRLARDPDRRRRLGSEGRCRVLQVFLLDRCIQAQHDLYEALLPKVRARKICGEAGPQLVS
jgi:glycosyltransferase involved in cell wall biosynthesis